MTKSVMKPRRKARLPQAPPMEPRHKRTLIVVADGARARFFEPQHDAHALVHASQADLVAPDSRLPNREIMSDRPGREPTHDPHKMEKHNFTAALARTLDEICGQYDRLVLVAPPRSMGELDTLLSTQVKNAVSHRVPKDLTASSPQALWQALDKVLPSSALA
jgi:protein required for attachment to host cells